MKADFNDKLDLNQEKLKGLEKNARENSERFKSVEKKVIQIGEKNTVDPQSLTQIKNSIKELSESQKNTNQQIQTFTIPEKVEEVAKINNTDLCKKISMVGGELKRVAFKTKKSLEKVIKISEDNAKELE